MDPVVVLSVVAVAIVVIFDFTNGFHDASNIIATVIASRAMTPVQAVVLVAIFEFLGPLIVGTAVANTIGNIVDLSDLPPINAVAVIICGIFAPPNKTSTINNTIQSSCPPNPNIVIILLRRDAAQLAGGTRFDTAPVLRFRFCSQGSIAPT